MECIAPTTTKEGPCTHKRSSQASDDADSAPGTGAETAAVDGDIADDDDVAAGTQGPSDATKNDDHAAKSSALG